MLHFGHPKLEKKVNINTKGKPMYPQGIETIQCHHHHHQRKSLLQKVERGVTDGSTAKKGPSNQQNKILKNNNTRMQYRG